MKQYKGVFNREDVLDFALFMDAMMSVKQIERETDGSCYIDNFRKVLKEFESQYQDLIGSMTFITNAELDVTNEPLVIELAEAQKRAIHVANYCMMLFNHIHMKACELDKLRRQKNSEKHPSIE